MIPAQLQTEVEDLQGEGWLISMTEMPDGFIHFILEGLQLPATFSKRHSRLLLKIPQSYPNGKPDMFWLEEMVVLASGAIPQSADQVEESQGQRWRRFSWHPANWNPSSDNLRTYIEFVLTRLNYNK